MKYILCEWQDYEDIERREEQLSKALNGNATFAKMSGFSPTAKEQRIEAGQKLKATIRALNAIKRFKLKEGE